MTDEAPPRRLRAADVIDGYKEIIEQLTQRGAEPYVTVEHTLNAKGDTQTSVKVSAPFGCDIGALDSHAADVETIAAHVYDQATGRYPRDEERDLTRAEQAKAIAKQAAIARNVAKRGVPA